MLWVSVINVQGSLATIIARRLSRNSTARSVIAGGPDGTEQSIAELEPNTLGHARLAKYDGAAAAENRTPRARPYVSDATRSDPNCSSKRAFDIVVASIAIVVLLLLFVSVAIAVAVDTPGPILFRQWRGGRNGRRFQIFKFRTMTCMEDGADVCQARPGDARVTRVGRLLRKTSIDEFPQLYNVIRGDMSLVGPRPHALIHDSVYSTLIAGYTDRQSVRPGMTGWAQVNGCRGETRDTAAMEERVKRDLEYIRRWSFRLDIVIMAKTVKELLSLKHAY